MAGRVRSFQQKGAGVSVEIETRGGGRQLQFAAARIVNCTGPRNDIAGIELPIISDLCRRGLAMRNPLGLGIETVDSAVVDVRGRPSTWLYALGSLTRGDLWEISSVAELNAQAERLVERVAAGTRRGFRNPSAAFARAV